MRNEEIDNWVKQIRRDIKALQRIIIEKENMIVDLEKKMDAILQLKHIKGQGD